jgi:hypothetical protein
MMPPIMIHRTPRVATWWLLAAAALLPVWRGGSRILGFFDVGPTSALSDHAPNLWVILQALPVVGALSLAGLAMAASVCAAFALAARWVSRPPHPDHAIDAALLVALVMPGLLPGAHWTDFIPAGLCAIALAARRADSTSMQIAVLTLTGVALSVAGYEVLTMFGAVAMITATVLVTRRFLVSPANDNGLPLNPFIVYPA